MSDSVDSLGSLELIDLSVPLEDAAVSEPMPPSIHYVTHEAEGLAQMQQFFGIDPDDLVYSNGQGWAIEKMRVAFLARAVQTRLPYIHNCSSLYCLRSQQKINKEALLYP